MSIFIDVYLDMPEKRLKFLNLNSNKLFCDIISVVLPEKRLKIFKFELK